VRSRLGEVTTNEPKINEDDVKMKTAEECVRRDIAFDVRMKAGKTLVTLRELQKWFNDERDTIFNDHSLSADEQHEQYVELRDSFNQEKRRSTSINSKKKIPRCITRP